MSVLRKSQIFIFGVSFLWFMGIAVGMILLMGYSNTPGEQGQAAQHWPQSTKLAFDQNTEGTFLVFMHPQCACSKATLSELERLLVPFQKRISVQIIFAEISKEVSQERSALIERAESLPNVKIIYDQGDVEAKRFGAETSGQAYLYNQHGELVFQGGITSSRGHEGDSPGRRAIMNWLENSSTLSSLVSRVAVFGCGLQSSKLARYLASAVQSGNSNGK